MVSIRKPSWKNVIKKLTISEQTPDVTLERMGWKCIGSGSSRCTYSRPRCTFVIKLNSVSNWDQCTPEYKMYQKLGGKDCARIFFYGKVRNTTVIVMERLKEIKADHEWVQDKPDGFASRIGCKEVGWGLDERGNMKMFDFGNIDPKVLPELAEHATP